LDPNAITAPQRRSAALVFQDPNLFPWLTVRKNIEAGVGSARDGLQDKRHEVDDFMRLVGLENVSRTPSLTTFRVAWRNGPPLRPAAFD